MPDPAVARQVAAFHRLGDLTEPGIAAADDAVTVAAPSAAAPPPVDLPLPPAEGPADAVPLVGALAGRRTRREAPAEALDLAQLAWVLQHAARADAQGRRPHPSAGARYALRLDVVALRCDGVPPGVHRYEPIAHGLRSVVPGDARDRVGAAFGRDWVAAARAVLVVSADLPEATAEHEVRGYRYALLEAGHLAQNLLLLATAAGSPACPLGGFADRSLADALGCARDELPLYAVAL